jgi:hypothetical protein
MTAPAKFDATPLIEPARAAMIALWRERDRVAMAAALLAGKKPHERAGVYVSAVDLAAHLDRVGCAGDRRFSGVVFTAPRALWCCVGYDKNPRRHNSPTPLFALREDRARELGL